MRRTFRFVIVCCFLLFCNISLTCIAASDSTAMKNEIVQEYTKDVIPEEAVLVDSRCLVQYQTSSGKSQIYNDDLPVIAEAYTYRLPSDTEETFHTILVVEVTEKIRISENDRLEISINYTLRNYSPEDGLVFSRKNPSSEWSDMRKIKPVPTSIAPTNTILVFGSEIESRDPYTLILLSFPSKGQPDTDQALPEYIITFIHDDRINIPLYAIIAIIGMCLVGAVLIIKHIHNRRMNMLNK